MCLPRKRYDWHQQSDGFNEAAVGATVGTLTMMNAGGTALATNFILTKGAAGFFAFLDLTS